MAAAREGAASLAAAAVLAEFVGSGEAVTFSSATAAVDNDASVFSLALFLSLAAAASSASSRAHAASIARAVPTYFLRAARHVLRSSNRSVSVYRCTWLRNAAPPYETLCC